MGQRNTRRTQVAYTHTHLVFGLHAFAYLDGLLSLLMIYAERRAGLWLLIMDRFTTSLICLINCCLGILIIVVREISHVDENIGHSKLF